MFKATKATKMTNKGIQKFQKYIIKDIFKKIKERSKFGISFLSYTLTNEDNVEKIAELLKNKGYNVDYREIGRMFILDIDWEV